MPFPKCLSPWCLGGASPYYLVVAIHASIKEDLDHSLVAIPCCQVQRGVLLSVATQEVGVCVEEHLHHLQPPVERCQVQRGLEFVVSHGGVCELLQEHLHHLRVAILCCTMQGRLVVVVLRVNKHIASERRQAGIWLGESHIKPLKFK